MRFAMKRLKSNAIKFDVFIITFSVIFFFVIGIASGVVLDKRLNENVSRRAVSELSTTAKEQAQLVEREIERQFIPLNFLAAYLGDGNAFITKETQNMIDTLVETNTWCTVGYADLEGNTISYEGENLGNISQRAYFREIADGSETQKVEYLSSTNMIAEPRFLFSVPVYEDGSITAVLFASKETSVMEPILLSNDNAENNARVFVISEDGTILCANNTGHNHIAGDNFYSFHEQSGYTEGLSAEELRASIKEKAPKNFTCTHDVTEIISCCPMQKNNWAIIASADKNALEVQYGANLKSVRIQVAVIMIAYGVLISFIMIQSFHRLSAGIDAIRLVGEFQYPEEALEYAKNNTVELAILDISMPGMTGLELAEKLRERYPNILIVFITAYDDYIRESNQLGADDYIVKPYRRETIEKMAERMSLLSRRLQKSI